MCTAIQFHGALLWIPVLSGIKENEFIEVSEPETFRNHLHSSWCSLKQISEHSRFRLENGNWNMQFQRGSTKIRHETEENLLV